MTDRPGDGAALEAEPIEVEAVAEGEPAADPETRAATRRRRRGWLFLLLWLLPVVLIAALGYLVAAQPERVAAFLAGQPPDMATAGDIDRLVARLSQAESKAADRAQVEAHSAAISANREQSETMAGEVAALRRREVTPARLGGADSTDERAEGVAKICWTLRRRLRKALAPGWR